MKTMPLLENHHAPLILLGGTLCNGRLWQPLTEQLNVSSFSCITLSAGKSAHELATQLLEVLPPRFCLAGFSLGAMVALQMVALAPHRIAGLALLSVNPLRDLPANAAGRRAAVKEAARLGIAPWLTKTLWPKYVAPHRLDNASLHQTIVQMAEECGIAVFADQTEVAISRDDHRAALATFPSPILIINGAYDAICTHSHHQSVAAAAAHARWITLPESGHFLPLEEPKLVAIAMRNWIQESQP
ncbi:pimeloyl-ACP methyl ester carboxylesterase [Buttiauxella sp. BIGb0471]|uniref:alpha/beta fold hydrolase n=1 Tax=Buttiauxella sp. BIGb0471 TaxID=2940597 RepID=UPI00216A35E0|nr:alpha/beta hydrolase [Buttiauxella sp. BIGb0471]MCS3602809.1 pimeloyl-ACP methyl ester carboxylesterase [Buttiauxella sp. BIGb0471]